MRIGELSRRAGVPVPTVKYYVREGLMPPGERTHANQARYTESHLRRLKLVRTLVELAALPVGTVRELMAEVDSADRDLDGLLGDLSRTLARRGRGEPEPVPDSALDETRELARRHGLIDDRGHGPIDDREHTHLADAAAVVASFRALGHGALLDRVADTYAEVARRVSQVDLASISGYPDRESTAEAMIVGTLLGEALLAALRRLGHATASKTIFPEGTATSGEPSPSSSP